MRGRNGELDARTIIDGVGLKNRAIVIEKANGILVHFLLKGSGVGLGPRDGADRTVPIQESIRILNVASFGGFAPLIDWSIAIIEGLLF